MTPPRKRKYFQNMMIQLLKRFAAHCLFLHSKAKSIEQGSFCECLYSSKFFFVQGLTLDERGRFSGEAEKRLEEVRILFSIFFMNYFTRK